MPGASGSPVGAGICRRRAVSVPVSPRRGRRRGGSCCGWWKHRAWRRGSSAPVRPLRRSGDVSTNLWAGPTRRPSSTGGGVGEGFRRTWRMSAASGAPASLALRWPTLSGQAGSCPEGNLGALRRQTCSPNRCVTPGLVVQAVPAAGLLLRSVREPLLSPDGRRVAFTARHVYGPEDLLILESEAPHGESGGEP